MGHKKLRTFQKVSIFLFFVLLFMGQKGEFWGQKTVLSGVDTAIYAVNQPVFQNKGFPIKPKLHLAFLVRAETAK